MSADVYRFTWTIAKEGYSWVREPPRLANGGQGKKSEWMLKGEESMDATYMAVRAYAPLTEFPGLYRTFSAVPFEDRDAILAFVNKYGLLGINRFALAGDSTSQPELVHSVEKEKYQDWARKIELMRQAVEIWDLFTAGDTEKLSQYIQWSQVSITPINDEGGRIKGYTGTNWCYSSHRDYPPNKKGWPGEEFRIIEPVLDLFSPDDVLMPAYFLVQRWINENLAGRVTPRLLYDPNRRKPVMQIIPKNLLSAMWLQFARTIDGNKEFRACKECGRWFEISHKQADGRTRRREFCSDPCKSKDYRKRRDSK
jgi:hypothetical protein